MQKAWAAAMRRSRLSLGVAFSPQLANALFGLDYTLAKGGRQGAVFVALGGKDVLLCS